MRALEAAPDHDAIVLGDHVLDHEPEVREAAAQERDRVAESVAAAGRAGRRLVVAVVGMDELVDRREVARVEHVGVESRDEVLVGGRHARSSR